MSASISNSKFDLHLPGLLKVLAEHLYSDRRVGVRELLQNAHDSCSRRKIEESDNTHYQPRIDVRINRDDHTLEIDDNGCGLTADEIVTYLATIGRGYTRQLREEIALSDPERYRDLIGQFGLGFLSAFLVASEVEVQTLSYKPGSEPMCWQSNGDETYKMSAGHRQEIGTTVRLKCKPAMRYLLDQELLANLVRHYCDLLPFPIYVAGENYSANQQSKPWAKEDCEQEVLEYLQRRTGEPDPIWIMRLSDCTLELDHDSILVPLAGVLYIPASSIASLMEYGDATVFIRNMFICERNRSLLPNWAKFVRGIIETPMLQPTASREDIHEDENLNLVQMAIEKQLLAGLDRLSREDIQRWNHVVTSHSDLVMGWATLNESFFKRIANRIQLQTSRGPLSIPEYLRQSSSRKIYFQTSRSNSLQEKVLMEGRNTAVVDASWFGAVPFLEMYSELNSGLELIQIDADIKSLINEIKRDSFAKLLSQFRKLGSTVRLGEFKPTAVPAVLCHSPHAEFVRDASSAIDKDELMPGIAEILGGYVEQLTAAGEDSDGVLFLNASSKLICDMALEAEADELSVAACQIVVQVARIFSGRMMDARDGIDAFETLSLAISEVI